MMLPKREISQVDVSRDVLPQATATDVCKAEAAEENQPAKYDILE